MRKKGDNSLKSAGKSAIPPDQDNDFILGFGSQRPTRRMGRKTLPLRKWRNITISLIDLLNRALSQSSF